MYYDTYGYNNDERTLMTSTYIVSDYMKPSLNRFLYLINASTPDYWIHSFFRQEETGIGYLKVDMYLI